MEGISCILTTYNDAIYLEEGINSLKSINVIDHELIIVDDGSTDGPSLEILNRLKQEGLQVIRKENGGVGSARNLGIKNSKYNCIIAMDGDDKLNADFLTEAMSLLQKNKEIHIVYGNVQRFGDSNELVKPGEFELIRLLTGNFISVSALFRKELWEKTGGYDENLPNYEDWEFWLKCAGQKASFQYLDMSGLYYRKRDGSKIQRVANPEARERVVSTIVKQNINLYNKYLPEVIGKLHNTITSQQYNFNEQLTQAGNSDKADLLKELEKLRHDRQELIAYYEGSVFWKIKLLFNKIFKSNK